MSIKLSYQILLTLVMAGFTINSYGQQQQDERTKERQQHNYYRNTLQVDSVKADQVMQVQNNYKRELNTVMADSSLNEQAKRVKIDALIKGKNRQLRKLLSPAQQEKIIPTTEREQSKDANTAGH